MGNVTKDKKETSTDEPEVDETQELDEETEQPGPHTFTNADGVEFTVRHDEDAGPESDGQVPHLREGARVEVVAGPSTTGPNGDLPDGSVHRMASVQEVYWENGEEALKASNPANPERRFAKVKAYDVLTRDARNEILHVTPDQIRTADTVEGWGRGRI